ncbi:hypothetical protein [Curtobacterium sp. MCPF17_021]|uniref:hypothetical protein n=1 Tax=Curtobacterium sp. MCPF17_021 TaxID=2175639 RepID=UPI000DA89034|nr:hypothetical protein [Curtobacterium sp. MCPF17_021]WIE81741.1 hypothetical protein DEJ29_009940 [Curtobacterium sp. MCPF17_021]
MVSNDADTRKWSDSLLDLFGPLATALRKNYVLSGFIALTAVAIGLLPKIFVDDDGVPRGWTTPVVIVSICSAAAAVALDRIGDDFDKRAARRKTDAELQEAKDAAMLEYTGSVATAERSVSELNIFMLEAIEVMFLEASSRSTEILALRRHLARSAANSIGPNTRATYYTLLSRIPGNRVLGDPKHGATVGRRDKPERPWRESENAHHDIWRLLDQPDEHPDVHNYPDVVSDLVWENVRYDTFLTVPVKAHGVVFGVLSVNNAAAGSIGEVQRSVIVAMARAMALVLASDTGARTLKTLAAGGDLSHGAITLYEDDTDTERT